MIHSKFYQKSLWPPHAFTGATPLLPPAPTCTLGENGGTFMPVHFLTGSHSRRDILSMTALLLKPDSPSRGDTLLPPAPPLNRARFCLPMPSPSSCEPFAPLSFPRLAGHTIRNAQGSILKAMMIPVGTATCKMDGRRGGRIDQDLGLPLAPLSSTRPCLAGVRQTTTILASPTRHLPISIIRKDCGVMATVRFWRDAPSSSTPRYAVVTKFSKTPATGVDTLLPEECLGGFLPDWIWTGQGLVVVRLFPLFRALSLPFRLYLSSSSFVAAYRDQNRPLGS
ncbi:hypothetical protein DFH09DRAFT_1358079 [Mycena vulgaris]|nr:hypothetical protein DFH09DRAFT_1358079 [Mycena vulgaris]